MRINKHIAANNIICEELKDCTKNAKGCKEQLTIDQIILEQTVCGKRNLYASYIDYQKAFDSVPHSWLIEVLKMYRISPELIKFIKYTMCHWRTNLNLKTKDEVKVSPEIQIRRGIFKADCLSPLLFLMALNPLSNLLRSSGYGFKIKAGTEQKHLRLYGATKQQGEQLIKITKNFSEDIKMSFGYIKCRNITIFKGKVTLNNTPNIQYVADMDEIEQYKYLGIIQSSLINYKTKKQKLIREFKCRLYKIA